MPNSSGRWLLLTTWIGAILAVVAAAENPSQQFKIRTKRDNDRVRLIAEKDQSILSVQSPFGISEAAVERLGDRWPDRLLLRLHLSGLEHLSVSNGKLMLVGNESSAREKVSRSLRLKSGREEKTLDAANPLWTEILEFGPDGKPTDAIPLRQGYFQVALPKAFFADNPRSITINWIDFYRE